ncbi:WbqC family protein [Rhodobacter maris]|uniref:WbqC-like protein n=1 Tax=Rhodobacter maris TaxID=446682 RepID=A0A285T398_9RHOB|nr:WbqC family protein [Rhodobacter maris]SOC15202.1 WbqC-like protein [Rhodobacter maris]
MTTVAVMQPYFFPYAGYYRLLAAADVFVILDCVQFPRRGRVHRCALAGAGRWITLPLEPAPRDSLIREMRLAPDAAGRLNAQCRKLPAPLRGDTPLRQQIVDLLDSPEGPLVPYLERSLRIVAQALGFDCRICRSSALDLPAGLGAQQRILEIVRRQGGTRYINAPGGTVLYERETFSRAGIELNFLTHYTGSYPHFLPALFEQNVTDLRSDILEGCFFQPVSADEMPERRSLFGHERHP